MHGHVPFDEFLSQIRGFLGTYYVLCAVMNSVAALYLWTSGKSKALFRFGPVQVSTALAWLVVGVLFLLISPIAY